MAELVVTGWLRPQLRMDRQELERCRQRWEDIEEMHGWHACRSTDCSDCEVYREYLEMVEDDVKAIQDRARSAVALTACCRDGSPAVALRAAAEQRREEERNHNNFMMDFENYVLSKWDSRQGIPTGPRRYENEDWAELMKGNLEVSDSCWVDYVAWVSQGGGDEYFQEDEQ